MATNLVENATAFSGVPFCNVSGEDLDIQQVKAYNNGAIAGDGEFYMKWYDSGKYSEANWWDPLNDDSVGWGDGEYEPVAKTFAPGEWFLVTPYVSKPTVQVAGALVSCDTKSPTYTITLVANSTTSTGNPYPVDCEIKSIIAMNGKNVAGDGEYFMKWYDSGKYVEANWWDPLNDDSVGWGDSNYDPIEKTFLPGQGFLVTPYVDNPSLKVPNPLYIAE